MALLAIFNDGVTLVNQINIACDILCEIVILPDTNPRSFIVRQNLGQRHIDDLVYDTYKRLVWRAMKKGSVTKAESKG